MKPICPPLMATVGQVARAVGCSPHIVRVLADAGRVPYFRDYNGWRRFISLEQAVQTINEKIADHGNEQELQNDN